MGMCGGNEGEMDEVRCDEIGWMIPIGCGQTLVRWKEGRKKLVRSDGEGKKTAVYTYPCIASPGVYNMEIASLLICLLAYI